MEQNTVGQNSIKAFSIASLVFGILSLITCCTGILPLAAGGLSILFAVLSHRQKEPLPSMSLVGMILAVIGMILGLILTVFTIVYVIIPVMTDPEAYRELNTFYETYYGMSLDELMGSWNPSGYGF